MKFMLRLVVECASTGKHFRALVCSNAVPLSFALDSR